MTGGTSPIGYLKAWHTNLYLSADADKVREALAEGEAALHLFNSPSPSLIRALNSDISSQNRKLQMFLFICRSVDDVFI